MTRLQEFVINEISVSSLLFPPDFGIKFFHESRPGVYRLVYESPFLKFSRNCQTLTVNEKFNFMSANDLAFIKVEIGYEDQSPRAKEEFYFLLEELNKLPSINFKLNDNTKVSINFAPENNEHRKRYNSEPNDNALDDAFDARNIIDKLAILKDFVIKLSLIRRITNDLLAFVGKHDVRRDVLCLLFLSVFVMYPKICCAVMFVMHFVTDFNFKIRHLLLKRFKFYFSGETTTEDIRKNLLWIEQSQLAVIELTNKVEELFLGPHKNRILQAIFRYMFWIYGFIFLISIFSIKYLIVIGLWIGLGTKYKDELRKVVDGHTQGLKIMFAKIHDFGEKLHKIELFERMAEGLTNRKVKLVKYKFYWEAQQLGVYSPPRVRRMSSNIFEDLKDIMNERSSSVSLIWEKSEDLNNIRTVELDSGWEWTGEWHIVKSSFTDSEGWIYKGTIPSFLKPDDDRFKKTRRRQWIRECTKRTQNR